MDIHAYLIDDHPISELVLNAILDAHINIQQFSSVSEIAELSRLTISATHFTLFVIETDHPDKQLLASIFTLKSRMSTVKILAFTRNETSLFKAPVILEKVDGIVLKKDSISQFENAITHLATNKPFVSLQVRSLLQKRNNKITDRENQILALILKGYSRRDIADQLKISEETVKSHRKNLMQKFSCKNTSELIQLALRLSLVADK